MRDNLGRHALLEVRALGYLSEESIVHFTAKQQTQTNAEVYQGLLNSFLPRV